MFHPPDIQDVTINVYYRGVPVNDHAIGALRTVLKSKPATNGPEKLSAEDIKGLSHIFGINTIGDNQYTNDAKKGSRDYPVFSMASAETVVLKGRLVLKVLGTFQDEHGTPTMEYQGYQFETNPGAQRIEEIFFQAPTKGKYLRFVKLFEDSLKSLEWAH